MKLSSIGLKAGSAAATTALQWRAFNSQSTHTAAPPSWPGNQGLHWVTPQCLLPLPESGFKCLLPMLDLLQPVADVPLPTLPT